MSEFYQTIDFSDNIAMYEQFGHVDNYGDGAPKAYLHPLYEMVCDDLRQKTSLKLSVSSARIVYSLSDEGALEWHLDAENPEDEGTSHTLLIYFNSMEAANGGLLEFKNSVIVPQRGLGVLIDNQNRESLHRATPMLEAIPRKLIKITFFSEKG